MKKIITSVCFFIIFSISFISAETIFFDTVENDIPPNVYEENGRIVGIYPSIIKEVCSQINIEPEFQRYPWKRCISNIKNGNADAVFPPIRTKEREQFLYFPNKPMIMKKISIFSLKENCIKINNLDDLKGKIVGVNDGYSYGKQFDSYPGLKKDFSRNIDMQVEKLLKKRMDVAVSVESPFCYYAKKKGVADKIEVVYVIAEIPSYVAFPKALGGRGEFLSDKFGQILRKMEEDGVIQKITDSYIK